MREEKKNLDLDIDCLLEGGPHCSITTNYRLSSQWEIERVGWGVGVG